VNRLSNTYAPCEEQQLRALRMLAGCPNGATALTLLLHAFEKRCMTKLIACGYCDRETRNGLHGDRYRITQAGELKQVRRKGKADKSGKVTGRLNAASNRRSQRVF
jgi:hypothetical protein